MGCGGNCSSCGGCAKELVLTEAEVQMLRVLGQIPFLPAVRRRDDPTPYYLEDDDYSVEEYSLILQCLEKRGLISLDFDRPLTHFNDEAYKAYPIRGSMALTARGQQVLELVDYDPRLNARILGSDAAVETCGEFPYAFVPLLAKVTDLFLWDVKDTDDDRHKAYTGVSNQRILENLRRVDALGGRTRLRCILVNGVNTDEAHYAALAELAMGLSHCEGIEFLPYHAYGGSKMISLGLADNGRVDWIPDSETVGAAKAYVAERGVRVIG